MSDETEQGEREQPQEQAPKWGDPISENRQAELDTLAEQQHTWAELPEATRGKSPLKDVLLSGADFFWLALCAPASPYKAQRGRRPLGDAFRLDQLKGAELRLSELEGARLYGAHLEEADLRGAHLEGARLSGAQLKGVDLRGVYLEDADLSVANLEGAHLIGAHLEGVDLYHTNLKGVDLRSTWLDGKTQLGGAILDQDTQLGDIHWSGVGSVDLTQINWDNVPILGDEHEMNFRPYAKKHKDVVRAYRQLAAQLRAQGMADEADRFSYTAQIRQRGVLLHTRHLSQYLFSWLLYLLAGYGYQVWRTVLWYVATIAIFAFGYMQVTHGAPLFGLYEPHGTQALQWYEALVLSLASFHGRGFFPQGISLGDPVAILAASEAVIGLFVEISFIATFTQRYFANK